jgi:hypothetical protein
MRREGPGTAEPDEPRARDLRDREKEIFWTPATIET